MDQVYDEFMKIYAECMALEVPITIIDSDGNIIQQYIPESKLAKYCKKQVNEALKRKYNENRFI